MNCCSICMRNEEVANVHLFEQLCQLHFQVEVELLLHDFHSKLYEEVCIHQNLLL